jgi:PIN like domain
VKFFFDHNMSPAMARALRELVRGEHEITFLAEKFPRDVSDIDWITGLSNDGQWIVISGDRRITRNHAEYHAFRNSNLIGLFLSQGLNKAPVVKQLERILALWSTILTISATVQGGAMYELPVKSTKLRQLKI